MRIDKRKDRWYRGLLAATAVALAISGGRALAKGTPSRARYLAIAVCGTCHGVDGNSTNPMFPELAGQRAWYIEQQLKEFRDHKRGDPYAIAYMYGMASRLSNATIDALAKYYARQKPGPGKPHPAAEVAAGDKIFHQGIPSQGVPACAACHGPQGLGNKQFPRLAGQHAKYIMKQLQAYQSNMRQSAIMHGMAVTLHGKAMQAVADYLASLP